MVQQGPGVQILGVSLNVKCGTYLHVYIYICIYVRQNLMDFSNTVYLLHLLIIRLSQHTVHVGAQEGGGGGAGAPIRINRDSFVLFVACYTSAFVLLSLFLLLLGSITFRLLWYNRTVRGPYYNPSYP